VRAEPARAACILAAIAAPAIAMRLHNVGAYPVDWGFDASQNWQYIGALMHSWRLPALDAAWSTADPPLFFYLSALLLRMPGARLAWIPLLNTALGLGVAALAAALARREEPSDWPRALLAAGLLLYLPAHIQLSVMVNEEMLAAFCGALALFIATRGTQTHVLAQPTSRSLCAGAAGGAAMLAKPSGVLVVLATTGAALWRARGAARARALRAAVLLLGAALLVGGWFYVRSVVQTGSPLPMHLPAHARMQEMPPGARGLLDYLRFPLATFTDPQLLDPALLHSVWGSTYASTWFDAHRYFLPSASEPVRRLGTLTLLLALLPSAAFGVGLARGARRAVAAPAGPDTALVLLTSFSLLGYAWYSWRNPWFAVLKGSALLGLCLPYAYYASEALIGWMRRSRVTALSIGAALALLALCVTVSGTFGLVFERSELPGLVWEAPQPE
jgi:Dolichyl-phosphate-mannose-protein mannosyltransferase